MKICKQCHAVQDDEAQVCGLCGAELTEEPTEAAPVTKKKPVGLIIGLVLAVLLVVAIIVGKGRYDQSQAQAPAETPTVQEPAQAPAAETPAEISITQALHTNAYGLNSRSIHFAPAEDGTLTYSFLNEKGETVSVNQAEVDAMLEQVVATCGDIQVTNRELQYYYDQQLYSFYSMYSNYLSYMLDTTKCLDEQVDMYGTGTWQDSFINGAVDMFQQIAALAQTARETGFTLNDEEQAYLESAQDLASLATTYGYTDLDLFIRDYIGPGATEETYKTFLELSILANCYANKLAESVTVSKDEINTYYDENAEMMQNSYGIRKVDKPVVNVRHILIQPTAAEDGSISDDAWAAAETQAQDLYNQWQAGAATEEFFAELATNHTQDPGSQATGGLYEAVYPGQMVPEFENWCFEDGRQVGDHGMVKTSYGYHIMFFSGEGDYIYWEMAAEDMCRQEKAAAEREAITAGFQTTTDLDKVMILDATAPSVPVAEESAAE